MRERILRPAWRSLAVATLALAGCGQTEQTIPSTAIAPATIGPAGSPAPIQGTGEPATTDSSPVTFGDLADRVNAAWADVRTYRAEFRSTSPATPPLATPDGTNVATPIGSRAAQQTTPVATSAFVALREVVLPDKQRQTLTGSAEDDHEAIVVGDTIFLRGPFAQELVPDTGESAWLSIPVSALTPESEAGHVLAGLSVPPTSPLASLRSGLRPQELRELGPVEIEGRSCTAYGGADTTAIGTRQDITVAVDAAGLPCSIETRVGTDLVSQVVYTAFNEPLTIEAPSASTPAAGLLPAATPVGRD